MTAALKLQESDFINLTKLKSELLSRFSLEKLSEKNELNKFASCDCSGSCKGGLRVCILG